MNYKRILGAHRFAIAAGMVTHFSGLCFSSRLQLGHPEKVTYFLSFCYCHLSHPNPSEAGGEGGTVHLWKMKR